MANKRGSLIKEGTLAPQSSSLIENILARGRSAGHVEERLSAPEPDPLDGPAEREAIATDKASTVTQPATPEPSPVPPVRRKSSRGARLLESTHETGPLVVVTTRLPTELDDWLETEVFNRRRAGIRKQDLIAAGLRLLREDLASLD